MLTHSQALQRADLPTLETLVRRILRHWHRATASDIESGARWYDEAGVLAASLSRYVDGDVRRAAAVISALSPRTTWARNVAGATALLQSGPTAARATGCMGPNVERARIARTHGIESLNGPKTRRFAENIAGDREAVTVDVWAARVVGIDADRDLSRVGVYDAVEHAYRLAARRVGVDPATMQATTWIVARNGRAA